MTVIFPNFSKSSVLIVGDVMLDRYWYGSTDKISPEAPVPIVKINKVIDRPGGAANVAMNIASLGARSRLLGLTGVDEAAKILKKQLNESNIKWNFISVRTCPTIIKLRVMSRNQQLIRLDFEQYFNNVDTTKLLEQVELYLPKYKVLVLSDYAKGSLNCIEEIIKLARYMNVPVIVDPKGIQFSRYKGATLLTPNISEFESIVGSCRNEKILINRAQEIIIDYNLSALLITRSEMGMTLCTRYAAPLYFSTQTKEVYNVTGAGDTVVGVLSAALSSGKSLEKACFLANLAASAVIKKSGTSTSNVTEMKNIMNSHICCTTLPVGILDEKTLKQTISVVRNRGEKIVMTNGVFDILHSGHVSYLTNAKKLGDRLIVAVNSDGSTRRLKGKTRPINTLEQRMFILAALAVVDWVVPFYEDTPSRLVAYLSPDFLVKGGDYHVCDIEGSQGVLNSGGTVRVLNFQTGCSSSNIINAIKRKN
ncbi:bifunctional D-glycero-beta-D-manno-heptose-7-phosphate kinase/D-glycero-beta-D-manno-heptose 1-phosphate adenylyltransferase HldE [Blochmannia endosymbiont of Camponotus modoc]|uniref:bifunctional D-glycero-beta-D-manno-heptose-7-phosphate kinase/D-glycero-beta-D-manno-heptose 1-phosphate adenylyltransferase HldE n=1 Tax=Blochmannia endosymbiont of Camponotus modoc TaxID=2945587 RepID=UPI002025B156|nr:bifunctional D-glycero-beta-D-manno-heptose-7-phosphate kinase/D-glycero-beta-D-manno-heptose 1-phosphate adenylyltransferase HldE [Blochmannia endosymbiont of Camponotus modoc]URJ31829.1 bifunctional D-glycero-beta-D-manno-heptose-7-phosphate kinase/D-glycero-beta-D-manno-heptose 1-phosphate adenylyltransferase HldE [Blochmannia endosymbiont of Camponotus modoc]